MSKVKLVCSTTEDYFPQTRRYLQTLNQYSHVENVIATVGFVPDVTFFKELPHIRWISVPHEDNWGAPEGTNSIQHGSFVDFISDNPDDTLIYTDCDIVMQRPFTNVEVLQLERMNHGTVMVGWNSGPLEKLIHEAVRLQPKITPEKIIENWGDIVETQPCFNIGVMAAKASTWREIHERYKEKWVDACDTFAHRARQQWLVCWVMADLQMNREIMPYSFHTHAHYGLPEGVYLYGNGIAGHDDRIVLFRHRF